jgi:hypothetical protein
MTTQVEAKPFAVTVVIEFVFDLVALNRLVTRDAHVARPSAGVDLRGHHCRQPAIFDALSDAQPQPVIPQL